MVTENTTPNRGYQEPAAGNNLSVDIDRLVAALRAIDTDVASAFAAIVTKAALASPAFTGAPTAPTAAPGTDTGQLATTAFVRAALATLVDSAPGALDTLNELAAALGDDPNFAATVTALIGTKADAAATTAALAGKADAAATTAALALKAAKADTDTPNLTAKSTPVDADSLRIWDSVGAAFKRITFANLKSWVLSLFNVSGSAPVYACRAWVNFNGTGTVAIRGSGNVLSITDHTTGEYSVNFITPMPDGNYVMFGSALYLDDSQGVQPANVATPFFAGSARIYTLSNAGTGTAGYPVDSALVSVAFVR